MQPADLPEGTIEVEFDVLREDWSEYEAGRGEVTVRVRPVLVNLYELPDGTFATRAANIVAVTAHRPEHKGPPGPADGERGSDADADPVPVEYHPVKEPWNLYRLRGRPTRIRTRCIITQLLRHPGRFDPFGDPVFEAVSETLLAPPEEDPGHVPR